MGLSDLITQLPELIGQAVEANQWLGYTAIFAAMFLENLFPPIPSELIMPLGGFYVQQGQLDGRFVGHGPCSVQICDRSFEE